MREWNKQDQAEWEIEFEKRFGFSYKDFKRAFAVRFGAPIEHTKISHTKWMVSKWNEDEFDSQGITFGKGGNFIEVMEKLQDEVESNPNTTIKRLQHAKRFNILLLGGITESLKRDTDEVTTTPPSAITGVSHIGVGTDGTAESQSQTGLISAYGARKEFDVTGQRVTINQTGKYNMVFKDTDITPPVTLREAVMYNRLTAGTGHNRMQYPDFSFTSGQVITFQTNENQVNG